MRPFNDCITSVSAAGWTGATRAQARGVTGQIRQLQTDVMRQRLPWRARAAFQARCRHRSAKQRYHPQ